MFEKLTRRGRELNRDIKDCGKAEPGSQFFPEVQRLEKERGKIANEVRKKVILILFIVGLVSKGLVMLRERGWFAENDNSKPVPVLSKGADGREASSSDEEPDNGAGATGAAAGSKKKPGFSGTGSAGLQEKVATGENEIIPPATEADVIAWRDNSALATKSLQNRVLMMLKKYLPEADALKVFGEVLPNKNDEKLLEIVRLWNNRLDILTTKYGVGRLAVAFNGSVIPRVEAFPVEIDSLLDDGKFLIGDVSKIGKSEKKEWFRAHNLPYRDEQDRTLYLPTDDLYPVIVLLDFTRMVTVAATENEKEMLKSTTWQAGRAKVAMQEFMEHLGDDGIAKFRDLLIKLDPRKSIDLKASFPYLLLEFASEIADIKLADRSVSDEERIKGIEKFMYFALRVLEIQGSVTDPENVNTMTEVTPVLPLIRKMLENPERYLNIAGMDTSLMTDRLSAKFIANKLAALEIMKGKEASEMGKEEIYGNDKFTGFIESFMVPIARQLKVNASSEQDKALADFFLENAVPSPQLGKRSEWFHGALPPRVFYVTHLDENGDEGEGKLKHQWMDDHNLSYFNSAEQILYIASTFRYETIDGLMEQDVLYALNGMAGRKSSIFSNHHPLFPPDKGTLAATMPRVEGSLENFREDVSAELRAYAIKLFEGQIKSKNIEFKSGDGGNIESQGRNYVIKTIEATAYRLLVYLLDIEDSLDSPRYSNPDNAEKREILREMAENPHLYLTVTAEEIERSGLFKK